MGIISGMGWGCLCYIGENKAIHVTDGSQLLLDLIVKVVTVAEAAQKPYKTVCTSCEAVTVITFSGGFRGA